MPSFRFPCYSAAKAFFSGIFGAKIPLPKDRIWFFMWLFPLILSALNRTVLGLGADVLPEFSLRAGKLSNVQGG
jgi:hypothetical protein